VKIEREADSPVPIWDTLWKLAWAAAVVLIPWRLRFVLLARPSPPVYRDYTDFLLFASDIALIVALLAAALGQRRGHGRLRLGPPVLSVPLAGILIAGWLSILPSHDPLGSFYHSVRLLLLAGLYLALLNRPTEWGWIVAPAGIQAAIQGSVAIAQSLGQSSVGLASLGEYVLDPQWRGVSVVLAEGERVLRAYGLSDHPNILGGSLALTSLILLAASVWAKGNARPWLMAASCLSLIGLLLTFSRAAVLALVLGFGLLVVGVESLMGRRGLVRLVSLSGAAVLTLTPFVLYYAPALSTRTGTGGSFEANPLEARALAERATLNHAAGEVFVEHALGGIGLGALPLALQARYPSFPYSYQPAHFVLLDAAAETGLPGASVYLAALIVPWIAVAVRWRQGKLSPGLLGSSAALLVITLIGFFDYYPWLLQPGRLWQWAIWGLWAREYIRGAASETRAASPEETAASQAPSARRGGRGFTLVSVHPSTGLARQVLRGVDA
jgi:O-antigen ligase